MERIWDLVWKPEFMVELSSTVGWREIMLEICRFPLQIIGSFIAVFLW